MKECSWCQQEEIDCQASQSVLLDTGVFCGVLLGAWPRDCGDADGGRYFLALGRRRDITFFVISVCVSSTRQGTPLTTCRSGFVMLRTKR